MPEIVQDELLAGFIYESIDLLRDLPDQLETYRCAPTDGGPLDGVFRSVHTIKGNAGFFGLVQIKKFAHALENTLDDIRKQTVALDEPLTRTLVDGFDLLDTMLGEVQEGDLNEDLAESQLVILDRIGELTKDSRPFDPLEQVLLLLSELNEEIATADVEFSTAWSNRIQQIRTELTGEEAQQEDRSSDSGEPLDADENPTPNQWLDAEFHSQGHDLTPQIRPLLEWFLAVNQGEFTESMGKTFLDLLGALIDGAKKNGASQLQDGLSSTLQDGQMIFQSSMDFDQNLAAILWEKLSAALLPCRFVDDQKEQNKAGDSSDRDEAALVAQGASQPSGKESARSASNKAAAQKNRYLRVKEGLVDSFLADVSNLFITCERLKDIQSRMARDLNTNSLVDELRQINTSFSGQTAALQTSVVALRKVPARELFSKFPRVARKLATELGKQLDVHLEGEEIEIDKSLAEDLDGPLMHMIRNVCDHAIDLPQERLQRGVAETGNLWLNCELSKTHVVITIRDDGRGIDPVRLRTKVVEKEILSQQQAAALSDQQAVELVFHPGFSTAEKISDVSGRGVGLDVVRTTLREHNGDVRVESKLGVGSTFRLEIPIRSAVIVVDALLLKQEQNTFALPFEHIREIIEFQPEDFSSVQGNYVVTVRGKPYAAVPLSTLLGMAPRTETINKSPSWDKGLIVNGKRGQICLLVDDILGQRKLVVNDLNDVLETTENIDGVSQLGGGQLALVLNASELIESASTKVTEPVQCM